MPKEKPTNSRGIGSALDACSKRAGKVHSDPSVSSKDYTCAMGALSCLLVQENTPGLDVARRRLALLQWILTGEGGAR